MQSTKKTVSGGTDSDNLHPPLAATQNSTKQDTGVVVAEVPLEISSDVVRSSVKQRVVAKETVEGLPCPITDIMATCNPMVSQLHVFRSADLIQGTPQQPFISNNVLAGVNVNGAPLVSKGSGEVDSAGKNYPIENPTWCFYFAGSDESEGVLGKDIRKSGWK
ncbi:hypothetical protein ACOSQ3_005083 [Xanthoceras sorbifolium]